MCHVLNKSGASNIEKILKERFPKVEISIDELGPIVGAHLGPKGIGYVFISFIGSLYMISML
ncbi:MAG TPA: DegV family protein [Tissierellales bacterium]|nr:DegV family protein [Tissierellales bacterium]